MSFNISSLMNSTSAFSEGPSDYNFPVERWVVQLHASFYGVVFAVFFYINALMVFIFFKEHYFRQNARYILFINFLVNETIQSFLSILLYIYLSQGATMLSLVCAVFFSVISATSFYSPLFLAAMAMERYIAVCNPLRHVQICSNKWVCFVLCTIFFIGEIPNVVVFSFFTSEQPLSAFFTYKYCTREVFINSPSQNTARIVFYLMFFVPVWIVIIYTYFCIMIEAKRAAGDSSSISKAQKTVFLHGIQMLLCMTYFCLPLLELCFSSAPAYVLHHTRFISYFLTNLLPKILSPLIYGARDENFKKHLKFHLSCFTNNVRPLNVNSK